jgi:IMP dehydrogenase
MRTEQRIRNYLPKGEEGMAKIVKETGLTFDDVLLVPRFSSFGSRFNGEISFHTEILPGFFLKYPIISSNMDSVTNGLVAIAMERLGGLGIVHRFMSPKEQAIEFSCLKRPVVCIGVGQEGLDRLKEICEGKDAKLFDIVPPAAVLIDIAHGDSAEMLKQIGLVKKLGFLVMAGNVATADAAMRLWEAGADCVKVGVGGGSLCTTRIQTGCGVPQLTAIMDVAQYRFSGKTIIADGGIRSGGDIIKSLAAGADAVMVGQIFAGATETPGERYRDRNGQILKRYRGMASREAQENWKGFATSVEGEATYVPYKGSIEEIFKPLIDSLLSGMSYQGAKDLVELRKNALFIKQSVAGLRESMPHAL